jgi:release factor glutamine methyltransferase
MRPKRARMVHFPGMTGKTLYPTVNTILKEAAKKLRPKKIVCEADRDEGWLDAEILLAHVLKKNKAWVVAHGADRLSLALRPRLASLVRRRAKREPVAYILGYKEFYGRPFQVNRHTLIPRPETELFIDVLKKRLKKNDRFLLWDVGTGCGEIAVTAAYEFKKAKILATDICRRALRVADANRRAHAKSKQVELLQADGLNDAVRDRLSHSRLPFVIAANLPYLPERDTKKLMKDVVDFEPHKALFGGKDGLDFIRQLLTDKDLAKRDRLLEIRF